MHYVIKVDEFMSFPETAITVQLLKQPGNETLISGKKNQHHSATAGIMQCRCRLQTKL